MSGTVTDPQGRSVPAAVVQLDGPVGAVHQTRTDPEGRFAFDAIADGRFLVRVFADGFQADPEEVVVTPGGADPAVAISLRVTAISDTIVVSAAGTEMPLSTLPASVTVLGRDDLRLSQAETVADALRRVPGLAVAANGGRGAVTSIFPRGGESDFTLVLFDGIRLNSIGGGFDAAHLQADGLERVEVVRGPQSALFGADAIGGVVQLVSRRAGPLAINALVEGGSGETGRASADVSGSARRWSWHGSGQYQQSQGLNGERTPRGEVVVNDDYTARHLTAGGGWQHARGVVRGVVRRVSTVRGNPGPFGSDPNGTSSGIDAISRGTNDQLAGGLVATQALGPALQLRADTSLADLDSSFRSAFGDSFTESRRATGRAQLDWSASRRLAVSAGAEALRERARSTFIADGSFTPVPIHRDVAGTFAETRYDDGGRLLVAVGVRGEHITRRALAGDSSPFSPRPDLSADTVVSWNPKFAASWTIVAMRDCRFASTRLKVNAGTGIRSPDAFEIAFTDNPGLKPERSRSVDVGIEQLLAGGRVALDAVWFANRYDDLIVAVGRSFADASRYRTDNISNARARGVELSASARLPRGIAVRAGYTHLRTGILAVDRSAVAPAPFVVGDPLIRRPVSPGLRGPHAGARPRRRVREGDGPRRRARRGPLLRRLRRHRAGAGVRGCGRRGVVAPVRAGAARGLRQGDEPARGRRYEEALGFPALGRSAMVGLRLAHGR